MTTPDLHLVRSRREVARQLGLTEGALRFAEKAGRIATEPGGGYDLARVRADLRNSSTPARRHEAAPQPAPEAATDTPRAHGIPRPRQGGMTFADARTANEVLKAQERRLRLDEHRGRLVDKSKALLLVRRLAQEERDSILAWPARIAAVLAAELGVDPHRLQSLLDASLRAHLTERQDVRISVD